MSLTKKKRVMTINGPISSGKNRVANLYTITSINTKIVKMPVKSIIDHYTIIKNNDSDGFEMFLKEECLRIINALQNYLEEEEHDLLIIITDIFALTEVFIRESKNPKISDQAKRDLKQVKDEYQKILEEHAVHSYISTQTKPRYSMCNIHYNKKNIPKGFFSLTDIENQHELYFELTSNLLMKHSFINENGKSIETKKKDRQFINENRCQFEVYRL